MAQRLKTVFYALASKNTTNTDNTDTTAPATTVLTFEAGAKTFVSVTAEVSFDDIITATGGTVIRRQFTLDFSPGGGAAYIIDNTASVPNTGENVSFFQPYDCTAAFQTELGSTGTATVQWKLLVDQSTGTTLGVINTCVLLKVTYWFDDTEATQVKTAFFPLAAPDGALATSNPATSFCTIPDFATDLPEAGVSLLNRAIIIEGNENRAGSTTDFTLTMRVTAVVGGAHNEQTTGTHEGGLATDRCYRHVFNYTYSGAQEFRLRASLARANHPQIWGFCTYSFTLAGTTRVRESAILMSSFMGSCGDASYDMVSRAELNIPGANVTSRDIGFFMQLGRQGATSNIAVTIESGTTHTFTMQATIQYAGNDAMMVRDDAAVTLVQGHNDFAAKVNTGASSFGYSGLNGWWIVNYDSDVPVDGPAAGSRSICFQCETLLAASTHPDWLQSMTLPTDMNDVPYYLSNQGLRQENWSMYPGIQYGIVDTANVSREVGYFGYVSNSGEMGRYIGTAAFRIPTQAAARAKWPFKRWLQDDRGACALSDNPVFQRRVLSTSFGGNRGEYTYHAVWLTLHECADWPVAGNVIDSNGGTVTLRLHDAVTGELLVETSRVGDGAYSIDWYDPRDVYVDAYEDNTFLSRSKTLPAGTP